MHTLRRSRERRFVYGWADVAHVLEIPVWTAQRLARRGDYDPESVHSVLAFSKSRRGHTP